MDIYDRENYSELKPLELKLPKFKKRTAHQVLVDRILEVTGDKKNTYGMWCSKVNGSRKSMDEILDICEKASSLPEKYGKGGYIINNL